MTDLDDTKALGRLDRGGMFDAMESYTDQFLSAYRAASRTRLAAPPGLSNVLFCGMGGSGIGSNLVQRLLHQESPVPVSLLKDYSVPGWVGPKSLVIAVSYSGQTEETLAATRESLARGATLIAISSGGQLLTLAKGAGAAHLSVPPGLQPRAALPALFGTLLGATNALRLSTIAPDARLETQVRALHKTLLPASPSAKNPAKRFAAALADRVPVWYGSGILAPVALRARCQLNENAKMVARNDELPEGNHNDLVALAAIQEPERFFVGFLRQPDEPLAVAERYQFVESILRERRVHHDAFLAEATSPLARVLQSLVFVDYVSVYAALARGVDPTPVDVIGRLKRRLEQVRRTTRMGAKRP